MELENKYFEGQNDLKLIWIYDEFTPEKIQTEVHRLNWRIYICANNKFLRNLRVEFLETNPDAKKLKIQQKKRRIYLNKIIFFRK